MKSFAAIAILSLLPTITLAAPFTIERRQQISQSDIHNAINKWAHDTSLVSGFLDKAADPANFNNDDDQFKIEAASALMSELDEKKQKAILDEAFGTSNPLVNQANQTLIGQGTFQTVVNLLTELANTGLTAVATDVTEINEDRCTFVLPAIDTYLQQAVLLEQSEFGFSDATADAGAARTEACALLAASAN
ncbi:hypothetical protein NA57DRAFT_75337 [Rhizodiscina lignyota]|uniref:Uncharacterized protein n=1 Tax=Rhizodiscina lignyota TaxID=1504668 RepID=A0A9P4IIB8_9PEZI|nr:hypothetical protein NA57DRAFT_75337 [Rhizodiscina lignyota]